MKKWFILLLAMVLCLCTTIGALAASQNDNVDTVSKSKTATNLNDKLETTVTLSFPAEEVSLDTDVVFVLDKSTSAAVEEEALNMLQELQKNLKGTSAKIKVGIVIFNKKANVTPFMDLATQYGKIEEAMKQEISSGTNAHAGLLAGKAMLDADKAVDASRKHLIFVSDGITYIFNEEPTAVGWSWMNDGTAYFAGPDNWKSQYGTNDALSTSGWNARLAQIGEKIKAQTDAYDYSYGGEPTKLTPTEKSSQYANSVEKALYLTAQVYKECQEAGYNCYALVADQNSGTQYNWGPSFMEYLAGGKTINFADIQAEILYMLGRGSTVTDVIGYAAGDYNFDLIPDSFTLTVGDTEYPAMHDGNTYIFGDKEFVVEYTPAKNGNEKFVFTINQNVTNFKRVQLSYKLQLTNPKTQPGQYGTYDRDGSKGYKALYTNNSAVLKPVDSKGNNGSSEVFNKPTVSYTVADVPKTGDNSMLALWAFLATCSTAALAFVLTRRRA